MDYWLFVEFCNLSYNSLNDDAIEFFIGILPNICIFD